MCLGLQYSMIVWLILSAPVHKHNRNILGQRFPNPVLWTSWGACLGFCPSKYILTSKYWPIVLCMTHVGKATYSNANKHSIGSILVHPVKVQFDWVQLSLSGLALLNWPWSILRHSTAIAGRWHYLCWLVIPLSHYEHSNEFIGIIIMHDLHIHLLFITGTARAYSM